MADTRAGVEARGNIGHSVVSRPKVAGAITRSVRSMLVAQGVWPAVQQAYARKYPQDAAWVEDGGRFGWVDLDRHVRLFEAAAEVVGCDGLYDIGRRRVVEEQQAGLFSRILRSWLRAFAGRSPNNLLRMSPYLWRAGLRNCGEMVLVEDAPGVLRYRVRGGPAHFWASPAYQAHIRGFADGMFDLVQVEGHIRIEVLEGDPEVLELGGYWKA